MYGAPIAVAAAAEAVVAPAVLRKSRLLILPGPFILVGSFRGWLASAHVVGLDLLLEVP